MVAMVLKVLVPDMPAYSGYYKPVQDGVWRAGPLCVGAVDGYWAVGDEQAMARGHSALRSSEHAPDVHPWHVRKWLMHDAASGEWVSSEGVTVKRARRRGDDAHVAQEVPMSPEVLPPALVPPSPVSPAVQSAMPPPRWWVVAGAEGAILRQAEGLDSREVRALPQGVCFVPLEMRGRRVRVGLLLGWTSLAYLSRAQPHHPSGLAVCTVAAPGVAVTAAMDPQQEVQPTTVLASGDEVAVVQMRGGRVQVAASAGWGSACSAQGEAILVPQQTWSDRPRCKPYGWVAEQDVDRMMSRVASGFAGTQVYATRTLTEAIDRLPDGLALRVWEGAGSGWLLVAPMVDWDAVTTRRAHVPPAQPHGVPPASLPATCSQGPHLATASPKLKPAPLSMTPHTPAAHKVAGTSGTPDTALYHLMVPVRVRLEVGDAATTLPPAASTSHAAFAPIINYDTLPTPLAPTPTPMAPAPGSCTSSPIPLTATESPIMPRDHVRFAQETTGSGALTPTSRARADAALALDAASSADVLRSVEEARLQSHPSRSALKSKGRLNSVPPVLSASELSPRMNLARAQSYSWRPMAAGGHEGDELESAAGQAGSPTTAAEPAASEEEGSSLAEQIAMRNKRRPDVSPLKSPVAAEQTDLNLSLSKWPQGQPSPSGSTEANVPKRRRPLFSHAEEAPPTPAAADASDLTSDVFSPLGGASPSSLRAHTPTAQQGRRATQPTIATYVTSPTSGAMANTSFGSSGGALKVSFAGGVAGKMASPSLPVYPGRPHSSAFSSSVSSVAQREGKAAGAEPATPLHKVDKAGSNDASEQANPASPTRNPSGTPLDADEDPLNGSPKEMASFSSAPVPADGAARDGPRRSPLNGHETPKVHALPPTGSFKGGNASLGESPGIRLLNPASSATAGGRSPVARPLETSSLEHATALGVDSPRNRSSVASTSTSRRQPQAEAGPQEDDSGDNADDSSGMVDPESITQGFSVPRVASVFLSNEAVQESDSALPPALRSRVKAGDQKGGKSGVGHRASWGGSSSDVHSPVMVPPVQGDVVQPGSTHAPAVGPLLTLPPMRSSEGSTQPQSQTALSPQEQLPSPSGGGRSAFDTEHAMRVESIVSSHIVSAASEETSDGTVPAGARAPAHTAPCDMQDTARRSSDPIDPMVVSPLTHTDQLPTLGSENLISALDHNRGALRWARRTSDAEYMRLIGAWHVRTAACEAHAGASYTLHITSIAPQGTLAGYAVREATQEHLPVTGTCDPQMAAIVVSIEWAATHTSSLSLRADVTTAAAEVGAVALKGTFTNHYDATSGGVAVMVIPSTPKGSPLSVGGDVRRGSQGSAVGVGPPTPRVPPSPGGASVGALSPKNPVVRISAPGEPPAHRAPGKPPPPRFLMAR